jgi:hypothetical protein
MRRILAAVPVDCALGVTLTVAGYRKICAGLPRTRTTLSASRNNQENYKQRVVMSFVTQAIYPGIFSRYSRLS